MLTLIARGLSNAEIEAAPHIGRGTLKTHIGNLSTTPRAPGQGTAGDRGNECELADGQ